MIKILFITIEMGCKQLPLYRSANRLIPLSQGLSLRFVLHSQSENQADGSE